jgi:hypothetical protein
MAKQSIKKSQGALRPADIIAPGKEQVVELARQCGVSREFTDPLHAALVQVAEEIRTLLTGSKVSPEARRRRLAELRRARKALDELDRISKSARARGVIRPMWAVTLGEFLSSTAFRSALGYYPGDDLSFERLASLERDGPHAAFEAGARDDRVYEARHKGERVLGVVWCARCALALMTTLNSSAGTGAVGRQPCIALTRFDD